MNNNFSDQNSASGSGFLQDFQVGIPLEKHLNFVRSLKINAKENKNCINT